MSKGKYLAKNIGLLTLSQFGTKFLSFFLVPLYTNILSTSDYGIYDLLNSSIGILIPVLTLNIFDGVLRFTLGGETDERTIFSIGVKYLFLGNFAIWVILLINHLFNIIILVDEYSIFFMLIFFIQSVLGVMTAFVRGIDKIFDLSIASVICSFIVIFCNVIFLCVFSWGLFGYFIANIIGPLVQIIYLFIRIKGWKYINYRICFGKVEHNILCYSIPMIANSIAWWVNGLSDRYIVTWFCGLGENGVYSVASKIPSILNIFQTIFNQAWTLSAVKDFDPKDENGFFSIMYNSYGAIMAITCSTLIAINRLLARLLYAKDFFYAWRYVPFLLIAILFGALSGYLGGIFTAVKNTKVYAQSTVVGAIANIIINLLLVPAIGTLGAAVATAISYWIIYLLRVFYTKRYINIKMHLIRDNISYLLLVIQSIIFLLVIQESTTLYFTEIFLIAIQIYLFRKEIYSIACRGVKIIIGLKE